MQWGVSQLAGVTRRTLLGLPTIDLTHYLPHVLMIAQHIFSMVWFIQI